MSAETPITEYLDPRDRAHADSLEGAERDAVLSAVTRYRKRDRLAVGDAIPALELLRLEDGARVALGSLVDERPLVLVFGSFT